MHERIEVQSRSPFELHQILTGLDKTPELTVESELFLPEGDGPFGCVIALHGSLGWADHHQDHINGWLEACLLYTSPSPRDRQKSRMPSSA